MNILLVSPATPATFDSVAGSAQPGDVIELAAGSYPGFSFGRDGAPGQPIVIRGSAGTIVNGSISLRDRAHLHLVGVTVEGGRIRFDRSTAIAVIGCTVQASADLTRRGGTMVFCRSEVRGRGDRLVATGDLVYQVGGARALGE